MYKILVKQDLPGCKKEKKKKAKYEKLTSDSQNYDSIFHNFTTGHNEKIV